MLTYGTPRLFLLVSDEPIQFVSVFGVGEKASLATDVFAEFFGSLFVIIGLGTWIAAVPLTVLMAVAAFYIHLHDKFQIQEISLHFLLVCVVLMLTGSCCYSVDYWLRPEATGSNELGPKRTVAA
jgi:putative oxidoreductase